MSEQPDNRALISRLLKTLKVMHSAHERQVPMGVWESDVSAIEDAIVALSPAQPYPPENIEPGAS